METALGLLVHKLRLFTSHEQDSIMNKENLADNPRREQQLLEDAARILRDYGLAWRVREPPRAQDQYRPDAIVEIGEGDRKATFVVEIKQRPRTAQAGAIIAQLRRHKLPALLLTDYVNLELAEILRRQELYFLDMEGNAYLRAEGLLIWVTGRKDTRRIQLERETRRAFQPTGLKVIFALLCRPELVENDYRALAHLTGVALGTVQWVMRDLIQEGYVLRKGRTARRLVQLERLLDEWALGYARDLKPRRMLGRYETRNFDRWREIELARHHAVWGGEAAAALLTGYLKPETLTLWVDRPTPRLLAELGLRQEERGRVEIRAPFWTRELADQLAEEQEAHEEPVHAKPTAPPVLVYAELLAIADARTLETANRIRNEWIDRPFQRYRARAAG